MAKPKAQTLQQRFGFADDDLRTSNHDEIMKWLDANSAKIAKDILGWSDTWQPERVKEIRKKAAEFVEERIAECSRSLEFAEQYPEHHSDDYINKYRELVALFSSFSGLGDTPPKPDIDVNNEWEHVVSVNKYIIGFVDLRMVITSPYLEVAELKQNHLPEFAVYGYEDHSLCFEVKTAIPSVGELLRQINMYREYISERFYVVSPDDKFIEQLRSQRIGFVKYPTGEIFKP